MPECDFYAPSILTGPLHWAPVYPSDPFGNPLRVPFSSYSAEPLIEIAHCLLTDSQTVRTVSVLYPLHPPHLQPHVYQLRICFWGKTGTSSRPHQHLSNVPSVMTVTLITNIFGCLMFLSISTVMDLSYGHIMWQILWNWHRTSQKYWHKVNSAANLVKHLEPEHLLVQRP